MGHSTYATPHMALPSPSSSYRLTGDNFRRSLSSTADRSSCLKTRIDKDYKLNEQSPPKLHCCRLANYGLIASRTQLRRITIKKKKEGQRLLSNPRCSAIAVCATMNCNSSTNTFNPSTWGGKKLVWIWTENQQVMTAAVERGWNTFIFPSNRQDLAADWSSMAFICPLFIEEGEVFDDERRKFAACLDVSSPQQLENLQPLDVLVETIIVNLLDWQVIPAENIIATFQGTQRRVLAVSKTSSEAQMFLEALEQGLGGVVLKVEDVKAVLELKDYFDRRNEVSSLLNLTKATVTNVQMSGMGDRVCVDLCSIMRPGEGLLVGSFARGLFLVHSECLESNYISSRPFRVNAGPVHAYVAIPGGKTSYLSELKAGKEVIIVDQKGTQRTAIVGRVKIETRPLVLVEAQRDTDHQTYSILLQNAETVALVTPPGGAGKQNLAVPVTALKVGDEILFREQGGARHTGIEIQEFILEK